MKKQLFAAVVLASTVSMAGSVDNTPVNIWTDTNGELNAQGTFRAVRNSASTSEYIGCSLYAYDTTSFSATCYAYSASGQYASCYTSDANMLKVVATLNPASYLYFVVNSDGSCDRVISVNASFGL